MRFRRLVAASAALSTTMLITLMAPPALAADAAPDGPGAVAEPATILGDLACQVLGEFFERC